MAIDPLSLIERKESSGQNVPNYKYGPGFSASGYYQIIDETWRRWAKAAGVDISQYPTAMSAPKAVQAQVAAHGYKTEGFRPWEAVKQYVGQESSFGAPGSGVISASGTAPAPTTQAEAVQQAYDLQKYLAHKSVDVSGFGGALNSGLGRALADLPPELQGQITIKSGFRTPEYQKTLWENAVRKYGSEEAARKWVAPPGRSQHGFGNASDLAYGSDAARQWMHANAAKYGLAFPLGNEPWHVEAAGARPDGKPVNYALGNAPAGNTQTAGAAPGVLDASSTPAAPAETAADGYAQALASYEADQAAKSAQQAQAAQQQAAAERQDAEAQRQQMAQAPQPGQPQGSAASLMASLLDRKRQARGVGPTEPGVLSAWSV